MKHTWTVARFTGNVVCSTCKLLPLDNDDTNSPCPGAKGDV